MNLDYPIIIFHDNEEFRVLLREMLTKNGFFHLFEANTQDDLEQFLIEKKDHLILIDSSMLSERIVSILKNQKNYLIFTDKMNNNTPVIAASHGIEKVITFPITSHRLIQKICSFV
jgi:DNA-binding NtrC family response regulator